MPLSHCYIKSIKLKHSNYNFLNILKYNNHEKLLFLLPAFLFISIAPAFAQDTNLVEKVVKDFNLGEMGIRFLINLVAIFIMVRLVYFAKHKNRDFMFTLILFNCVNFLICFLLSGANLGIGFAFGLFAIFSIMRYRTVTVPVKKWVTCLFALPWA